MADHSIHPKQVWKEEARHASEFSQQQLRLAAMAGHIGIDKIGARRAALIDLLADGRPHPREEIWREVSNQLGTACWGKVPQEALARDMSALRQGGVRIAYSRHPDAIGYYLQHPKLERPSPPPFESINWTLTKAIRQLSVAEKNSHVFAAADFALRQKRLILAEEHPEWHSEAVMTEARRLVFGVAEDTLASL